jgi:hypothetical protein
LTAHRDTAVWKDQQDALLLFSLLRVNSLYMLYALLAHLQEALHKQLVFCVLVMSAGCYQAWIGTPEVEQVMLETCKVKVKVTL